MSHTRARKLLIILFFCIWSLGSLSAQSPDDQSSATVIIYRPWASFSWGLRYPAADVVCDGRKVAKLGRGKYFAMRVSPGTHTFTSGKNHRVVNGGSVLDFEAGKTYYLGFKWGYYKLNIVTYDLSNLPPNHPLGIGLDEAVKNTKNVSGKVMVAVVDPHDKVETGDTSGRQVNYEFIFVPPDKAKLELTEEHMEPAKPKDIKIPASAWVPTLQSIMPE